LIEDVVADARAGLCEGHREILLLATDLGAYGRDRGTTLPALLHELVGMPGDFSLGLRNVQPRHLFDMMPALQDVLRTGRIGVVLSGALSGSNRILGLMKRGYRIEEFRKAVEAIKRASPCTRITTQIIVGFPGETDEDFEESIRLVRDGTVDAFVPYAFEASPGTEAAGMSDPVPQHVVTRRYRRLSELAHQLSR
jgi:tRNA-2-methylthio-N6-dimethylallyladenosine synthase